MVIFGDLSTPALIETNIQQNVGVNKQFVFTQISSKNIFYFFEELY